MSTHLNVASRFFMLASLLWMAIEVTVAQEPPKEKPLTPEQKEKLQERDRLHEEFKVLLFKEKKVTEAFQTYDKKLAIERQVYGATSEQVVKSLEYLAGLHERAQNFPRARPALQEILDIRTKMHGKDHYHVLDAQLALAQLEKTAALPAADRRRLAEASSQLSRVIELRREAKYEQALELAVQALQARRELLGEENQLTASAMNAVATLYVSQGDYSKAGPLYRQVLDITKQVLGEKHLGHARSLHNLAFLYRLQGDNAKAEPLFHQSLNITKQVLGEKHPVHARNLNNLALLYQSQGDYAKAEPLFRQALDIRKQTLGENHPDYATSLNNLASFYKLQGDNAKAEPLFHQSLNITKQVLGEKHPDYARSLNNLAHLYQAQGDYAKAEPLYRQVLDVTKQVLGEKHRDYATSLNNLAGLHKLQGDHAQAEPLYRQALDINKQVLGENHPDYALSLNNLANLYHSQGDHVKAEPLYRQALDITRRHLDATAGAQSERQQLLMNESRRNKLDAVVSVSLESKSPVAATFAEVLAWKGAVFARQTYVRQARRATAGNAETARMYAELDSVGRNLAALALQTPDPKKLEVYRRNLTQLSERKEELEAELSRASAEYRRQKELARLTPEQLQKLLPADGVLIDFLEYWHFFFHPERKGKWMRERGLAAFVVKPHEIVRIELGPVGPIAQAVDQWRQSIQRGRGDDDPAHVLRKLVWQPLETHVKDAKLVLLSPDGAISKLPFAALPGSKAGSYLIEEVTLAVLPVPQLLPAVLATSPEQSAAGLLTVGDVEYGGDPGQTDTQVASRGLAIFANALPTAPEAKRPQWPTLAGTGPESDAIAKLFKQRFPDSQVSALRKADATEAALRTQASKHRFLHIATHGFFADEKVRSALYPSEKQADPFLREQFGDDGFIGHNPELLSGLVLVGANSPIQPDRDDGILTALEIRHLDLDKVELAVLSACETGLGAVAGGEGVLGLQRAFQAAGARTMVTSLWQIPDKPTQLLMERFYTNLWQKKMSKIEALREAQLWMLREGIKHPGIMRGLKIEENKPAVLKDGRVPPLYWAAFVLSGDWR